MYICTLTVDVCLPCSYGFVLSAHKPWVELQYHLVFYLPLAAATYLARVWTDDTSSYVLVNIDMIKHLRL